MKASKAMVATAIAIVTAWYSPICAAQEETGERGSPAATSTIGGK